MINVLVIVMEAITMWLCLHIAFGEKIKKTKGEVVFFIPYVVVCVLCAYELISKVFYLGLWVFVFVWCKVMFGHKIMSFLIRSLVGIISVGILEAIVLFVYTFFTRNITISVEFDCVVACGLVLIVTILAYCVRIRKIYNDEKSIVDAYVLVVLIVMILFFVYVKFEFEIYKKVPFMYIFFFAVVAMVFIFMCIKQKSIYELEKKNLNYELQSLYGNAYDELLKEVRRRQHDYKNQLVTIESILVSADSETKIKSMRDDYLKVIESENEINSLLSRCYNPIIAGYIYMMYIKCKDKGIRLIIDVNVDTEKIDVKTKDIIEMLGVFINNACEHIGEYVELKRIIYLKLHHTNNKICIEVRNISKHIPYEDMSKLFEEGYSTKGENRGIGLSAVRNITKKYSTGVCVDNILIEHENWIQFSVQI